MRYFVLIYLLRFEMTAAQRLGRSLSAVSFKFVPATIRVENQGQIPHFLIPVKLTEEWGRMLSGRIESTRPNLCYTFIGRLLGAVDD